MNNLPIMLAGKPFALIYPLALFLAVGLSLLCTPLVMRLATRYGYVARPSVDRWHKKPTPLLGGIAIYLATIPVFVLLPEPKFGDALEHFWGLIIGATIVFALGLYDDLKGLSPSAKSLGIIVASSVTLLQFGPPGAINRIPFALVMVPLMLLFMLGVTNAFNLLDNMDGLSAGIAMIVALTLFGYNHLQGDRQTATLALLVAGACAGFLVFNFNPARVFMGDCGSLLLGFILSSSVVLGSAKKPGELLVTLLIPVAVMALPILDTTLVTIIRAANRRPISQGGRDHLSHRLVALGLSERQAVLLLWLISAAAGLLAITSSFLGPWISISLAGLLGAGIALFGVYLGQVGVYTEAQVQLLERTNGLVGRLVVGGSSLYKRQFSGIILDIALISISLLAAYLIKEEGVLEKRFVEQFVQIYPFMVGIKISLLYAFGAYRAIWRFVGPSDIKRIGYACILGSCLAVPAIWAVYRAEALNRSVLLIDAVLCVVLVVLSRMSFIIIRDLIARLQRGDQRRTLIVGANDVGELVLRAMSRARRREYQVVGFLDDDPTRQHLAIHSIPVLGKTDDLEQAIRKTGAGEVIVAVPSVAARQALSARAVAAGAVCRDAPDFFRHLIDGEPAANGHAPNGHRPSA
ncbi:MAG: hypothetical protein IT307_02220 [Chloroflexi bacterium]|nr:hypothetical protein [Chloroflexota bacterium]